MLCITIESLSANNNIEYSIHTRVDQSDWTESFQMINFILLSKFVDLKKLIAKKLNFLGVGLFVRLKCPFWSNLFASLSDFVWNIKIYNIQDHLLDSSSL